MEIYQHFRKEEHAFIDQILSWKEDVARTYRPKLTDFLDPRQQYIVQSLIGSKDGDIQLWQFGGGKNNERKRAIIAPFYEQIEADDFDICLLQATYQEKFVTLTHRDVLGTFISLGLKRDKLGDIYAGEGRMQLIVANEIAKFVMMQMTMVKHAKIRLEIAPLAAFLGKPETWEETGKTVSSLRLDTMLKEIYHVSRKEASDLIKKQMVKVNHRVVDNIAFLLDEHDIISVRSKGRSKLISVDGTTKKDRLRVTVGILR